MIVQVETVSFNTEPSDYIDKFDLFEESAQYVCNVPLDTLIDHIDNSCIVTRPRGVRHYDEAE